MLVQFMLGSHGSLLLFLCVFLFSIHRLLRTTKRRWLEWRTINRHSGGGLKATPPLIDPHGFNPLSLVYAFPCQFATFFFSSTIAKWNVTVVIEKRGTLAQKHKKVMGAPFWFVWVLLSKFFIFCTFCPLDLAVGATHGTFLSTFFFRIC